MKKKIVLFIGLFSFATLFLSAEGVNLKVGKFMCDMLNLKIELQSIEATITGQNTGGQVYIKEGFKTIAMGNYNIRGSRIIMEFGWASGAVESLKNQTRVFTIEDSETFYASGNEEEVWYFIGRY